MKHSGRARAFACSVLFAAASSAFAEDEIIVTANRRADSTAQDLPLAMNAFGADELRARAVEDLQSLSYAMPNVQLEDIGTARGIANFSIRGVGVNSSIASVDPAVGLFVDGVYYGLNAGSISDLFDIEAIEVLRGPQGVLFGRNVTGGAVLVRTRAPSDAFEAHGRIAVETGPNVLTEAAISGPIAPGLLSGRLAIYHADDDGWFENDFDGSSFGAHETQIYRASLLMTPAAGWSFLLRVEHGHDDGDGPASQNHAIHSRDGFDFAIDNRGYAASDWEQATLEANWRIGDGTVTSISGWRRVEVPWAADIDSTTTFVFHTRVLNLHEQWSQELRYAGAFGRMHLTAGAYYLGQDLLYIDERNFSPTFRRTGGGQGEFRSWSAFGNFDWAATRALTLSAGARYTEEDKDSWISRVRRAADDLDGPSVFVPGEGLDGGSIDTQTLIFSDQPFAQSWADLSPRASAQWRPNAGTNIYAAWSRAFRGGGANFRTSSLGLPPRAYDAEEQTTFEVGWKQDFADGRARLNAALFHNSIENMQRETNQPDPISGVQQIVLNAGDATIRGGEIEARFDVSEALTISAYAGYVDGKYDRLSEDLNGDLAIDDRDYALQIPRLAPWSFGAAAEYEAPLAGGLVQARASYNHRDAAFYNDSNLGRLAEADIIDANLAWSTEDGRWRVSVYGENLLNEATWGGDTVLPPSAAFGYSGGARPTFSPLNKGRVIGVELRLT